MKPAAKVHPIPETTEVISQSPHLLKTKTVQRTIPEGTNWTQTHDELLKQWKTRAFVEFYLQVYSLYTFQSYYNYLSLPVVILSTVAGASIFSTNNPVVKYMAASMTMVSAILSGLMRQIQPGERSTQHYIHAQRWNNLIRNIQQIMHLPYEQRPKVDIYISQLAGEMDAIDSSQPYPAARAIKAFMRRFGRRNFDRFLHGEEVVNSVYTNMHTDQNMGMEMQMQMEGPSSHDTQSITVQGLTQARSIMSKMSQLVNPRRRSLEDRFQPRVQIPPTIMQNPLDLVQIDPSPRVTPSNSDPSDPPPNRQVTFQIQDSSQVRPLHPTASLNTQLDPF